MVEERKVPKGYKKTEVGVIPEDWDVDSIGNLASISTGSKNTQDRVEDGEFPFFVRSSIIERINTYSYDGEAVLTAGDGVGTGKVFHYIKGKFDFHQRVYKISDFDELLNGYFFYLYFSNNFLSRIKSMTAKSSVDSVRMEMISDMKIPIPPLLEQQAIAEALSDVDNLITSLEKLIDKKQKIKQGTMRELLTGKRRLPGFTGDWEVKQLNEVCEIETGRRPKGGVTEEGDIPSLGGENIYNNDGLNLEIVKKVPLEFYKNMKTGILRDLDVLINKDGANTGKVALYKGVNFKQACINEHLFIIRGKNGLDNEFLFYMLCTKNMKEQISKQITSSAQPGLNSKFIYNVFMFVPNIKEQQAIAQILSDMDSEIEALEHKLEKYKAIKQGMMQELLTGRIRFI